MLESAARGIVKFNWEDSMSAGATFNNASIVAGGTLTFRSSFGINSNSLANGLPVIIDNAWVPYYTRTPVFSSNDEAMVSLGAVVGPEGN
jgi:hypothetical protein